jgi:predicted glycosyltransferase
MAQRVLLYVQHILGIGHLTRAARIANAMRARDIDVTVVQGGMAVEGIDWGDARLEYLPAIRAGGGGYADLVDADGQPVSDALRARRCERLMAICAQMQPDVIVIEAFPFGRRAMRFELLPLLEQVRSMPQPPVVACSIRDILHENRKPGLNQKTVDLLNRHFDLIFVHGDREFIALEESFPLADLVEDKVRYTGIVAPMTIGALTGPPHDVVVSAGGGAVGEALLRAALKALAAPAFADLSCCIITGPNLDAEVLAELKRDARRDVTVYRFRDDFPALLAQARLSVSQCGYNTAADVLMARCASVFVPSSFQGETEQTRRSGLLSARGLAVSVPEEVLTPDRLAEAMADALAAPTPLPEAYPDLQGAPHCARLVAEAIRDDADVVG